MELHSKVAATPINSRRFIAFSPDALETADATASRPAKRAATECRSTRMKPGGWCAARCPSRRFWRQIRQSAPPRRPRLRREIRSLRTMLLAFDDEWETAQRLAHACGRAPV